MWQCAVCSVQTISLTEDPCENLRDAGAVRPNVGHAAKLLELRSIHRAVDLAEHTINLLGDKVADVLMPRRRLLPAAQHLASSPDRDDGVEEDDLRPAVRPRCSLSASCAVVSFYERRRAVTQVCRV